MPLALCFCIASRKPNDKPVQPSRFYHILLNSFSFHNQPVNPCKNNPEWYWFLFHRILRLFPAHHLANWSFVVWNILISYFLYAFFSEIPSSFATYLMDLITTFFRPEILISLPSPSTVLPIYSLLPSSKIIEVYFQRTPSELYVWTRSEISVYT